MADIAPLFSMEGATCGSSEDWEDTILSYGDSVGLKDVHASLVETDLGHKVIETIDFTMSNHGDGALPVHLSWTVFALVDGSLLLNGITWKKKHALLRPGDNALEHGPIALVGHDGQLIFCVTLEF